MEKRCEGIILMKFKNTIIYNLQKAILVFNVPVHTSNNNLISRRNLQENKLFLQNSPRNSRSRKNRGTQKLNAMISTNGMVEFEVELTIYPAIWDTNYHIFITDRIKNTIRIVKST
jgi:hypothetical protein